MNRSKLLLTVLFAIAFLGFIPTAHAQIAEGIGLSQDPLPSSSRGVAMGGSLISDATGVDALQANPAALAPLAERDVEIGLLNRDHGSTATFFGNASAASLDATSLGSLGIAAPFAVTQGHFAIGVSYDRARDYTTTYSFKAVNPSSSFFNTQGFLTGYGWVPLSGTGTGNRSYLQNYDLAYALGLTYDVPDSGTYTLATPFTGGLQQSGTVTEEGGLNAVRLGGGIDIAEGVSAGATLNILFGTYDYTMNYQEQDVNGIYAKDSLFPPAKFQQANIMTSLHQDQNGASMKFGLQVRRSIVNLGVTVETPEWMHFTESSTLTGTANFGTNGVYSSDQALNLPVYAQEYDVTTPFRFGAGASIHLLGFTGAASIGYQDMSQLRFSNGTADMSALNDTIRADLGSVLSYQLGAEYVFPLIGVSLRAGYSYEPSPYKGDPSNYGISAISGGLGIKLSKAIDLEASLRHATYHTNHAIYNDLTPSGTAASANITDDAISRNDVSVTFSYRY